MLAAILAKAGVSVLMLEDQVHPKFAIGESLVPETGIRLRLLAEKYGVPELGWIGTFHALRDNISSACGVKRSFSFAYHRAGEPMNVEQINQFPTLVPPLGPDSHLFRQDVDAFLAMAAVRRGVVFRQQCAISRVEFGTDEVTLHAAAGETFRGRFLIDASGMRSRLSEQLSLRDAVPRFRTDTRGMYNHFVNLKPADLLLDGRPSGMPSPLGQATMHHVFDGGWIWVIPFNNHRDSTNPLGSVGLVLDRRKFPGPTRPPGAEFESIVARYPSIARHFAGAQPVRPWVGSGRMQYSSKRMQAHRLFQLPHAAANLDPLFSSGLSVLMVAIDLLAEQLLAAVAEDRFPVERFQHVEDVVNRGFDHFDSVISRAYDALGDYDLWNAWNRVWVLSNLVGTFGAVGVLFEYLGSKDPAVLRQTSQPDRIGALGSHMPEIRSLVAGCGEQVDAAAAGRISAAEASRTIFERLGAMNCVPPYMGFGKAEQRVPCDPTFFWNARASLWYQFSCPDPKWRAYFGVNPTTAALATLGFVGQQTARSTRRLWASLRDIFFAANSEWRYNPNALAAHGRLVEPLAAAPLASPLPEEVRSSGERP